MNLKHGLTFEDLYTADGLRRLDEAFVDWLRSGQNDIADQLLAARADSQSLSNADQSQLLISLAPWVEDFIGNLFDISSPLSDLSEKSNELAIVARCKRQFVQRHAARKYTQDEALQFTIKGLQAKLDLKEYSDIAFARKVMHWLETPNEYQDKIDTATQFAAAMLARKADASPLFQLPQKTDPYHLIDCKREGDTLSFPEDQCVERDGFNLTDPGVSREKAYLESHYCIWCHNQGKDSCRKGLKNPQTDQFKVDELGVTQTGCPLDEKVSEMNLLRAEGNVLGALAVAMVDNPMIAGTGHRICNDCMKACIFQKQDPVNIPAIETQTLDEALALPFGFEIYSLLSRWNPLNLRTPYPHEDSGYNILIAGMGPAGYTLAHHLMNCGHNVLGIDGLKIEPLDPDLLDPSKPIKDISQLYENLSERVMSGFGGVAEYGITVRWNKNYLKVIRLLLERRRNFQLRGGVRLGGTLTLEDTQHFDHVALCMGAGRPNLVPMKNALARGVRMASDFLMALQLTGASKDDSIANLQVRLPIVVIGGGLTAIDTATEALAYYPVQVEKFYKRYERLAAKFGEHYIRDGWTEEEREIADEFLAHARLLQHERALAAKEGRTPRIRELLQAWGGSSVVYRKKLTDSPSYRLNHEEVAEALKQGVRFMEDHTPEDVMLDQWGHARALKCREGKIATKTILVAAGTHPNTTLAREEPGFELMGEYFQAVDAQGNSVTLEYLAKPTKPYVLLSHNGDVRLSVFGDLHPSYSGNVVKAMASAKQGFPVVDQLIRSLPPKNKMNLCNEIEQKLQATVQSVQRLTPTIVEVVVQAPQAAQNFKPGQFFRLQNYETHAPKVGGTTLAMEGLAMTGAWVDREKGLVSTIVLEVGGSSDICQLLQPGEPCVLMGPTGTPTDIPENETVLLVGGGLGNAVLFSIGKAMRAKGCKVLYFAGYCRPEDRFKIHEIQEASDQTVWCCDEDHSFPVDRPQDFSFVGTMTEALIKYAHNPSGIRLQDVDRILTIGSDGMMAAVAKLRQNELKPYLKPDHKAIGSINSPMQCMMKEICAQCLQPHQNPKTGEVRVVFSCTNQDQPLDWVDFQALHERLGQNSVQEKLTHLWVKECFASM